MSELFYWLKISGVTVSPVLIVVIFLFMYPDKFEHWMAIFHRMLYLLTSSLPKIRAKFDRLAVASSIQDSVNGVCERINKEAPGVIPHALKIEWVDSSTAESFIKKGHGIVRLKHFVNQDRNIVDSTLLYLKVGLLPRSKNYLDETLRKGCEFKIASNIFLARQEVMMVHMIISLRIS